jgi:hypothetical protein
MDGHPPPLPTACTARLHPTGPREAAGTLVGHPAPLRIRTRREHRLLVLRVFLGEWDVGAAELVLDDASDPPTWCGQVTISGCVWRCTSLLGSGLLTLTEAP